MQQIVVAILVQGMRDRSAAEAALAQGLTVGIPWLFGKTTKEAPHKNIDIAS